MDNIPASKSVFTFELNGNMPRSQFLERLNSDLQKCSLAIPNLLQTGVEENDHGWFNIFVIMDCSAPGAFFLDGEYVIDKILSRIGLTYVDSREDCDECILYGQKLRLICINTGGYTCSGKDIPEGGIVTEDFADSKKEREYLEYVAELEFEFEGKCNYKLVKELGGELTDGGFLLRFRLRDQHFTFEALHTLLKRIAAIPVDGNRVVFPGQVWTRFTGAKITPL